MKSKFKFIFTLIVSFIMMFTYSVCFAADENQASQDNTATVSEEDEGTDADADEEDADDASNTEDTKDIEDDETLNEMSDEDQNDNTQESDFYSIKHGDVSIENPINGNAYIVGNNVTIKAPINGDAFIIAKTVTIEEGEVYSNLFVIADTLNINGAVYDLYSLAKTITIGENGDIYRDVHSTSETLNIFGAVDRNVNATFGNISFKSGDSDNRGSIGGDLNYTSQSEAQIEDGIVEGSTNFNQKVNANSGAKVTAYLASLCTFIITALVIYLLILWLAPKFKEGAKDLLTKKTWPVVGFGLLSLIVVPLVVAILLLLGITSGLAFILLAAYIGILLIAPSVFITSIAGVLTEKYNISDTKKSIGYVICIAALLWIIELIPIVGSIVSIITIILGMGITTKYILPTKSKN